RPRREVDARHLAAVGPGGHELVDALELAERLVDRGDRLLVVVPPDGDVDIRPHRRTGALDDVVAGAGIGLSRGQLRAKRDEREAEQAPTPRFSPPIAYHGNTWCDFSPGRRRAQREE